MLRSSVLALALLAAPGLASALPDSQNPLQAVSTPFVANVGQIQGPARYYALGANSAAWFEPRSVLLDRRPGPGSRTGVRLRVEFPNATGDLSVDAAEPTSTSINVLHGSDPDRWREGIATFREVRYRGAAPGTDVVYHVREGTLKYDAILAPGRDLDGLVLRYRGARGLRLAADGSLIVVTAAGDLREQAPFLYQDVSGVRVPVQGGYRILSRDEVGFHAASYDRALPLVVDPGLVWSTFLGGTSSDYGYAVTSDAQGNVYVCGLTASSNYPTTTGAYQTALRGTYDAFVTKLAANGSSVIWSTYLGGSGVDEAQGIALDSGGNVYVSGTTSSTDFPTTTGAFQRAYAGGTTDAFLVKLDPSGHSLVYSTYLGGSSDDYGYAVRVDGSGDAFLAGQTASPNLPTTAGVVKPTGPSGFFDSGDVFVARLNPTGTGLLYGTYLGTGSTDVFGGLALDPSGRAVVSGYTSSPTWPATIGALQSASAGSNDAFVVVLNSGATGYVTSTLLGGSQDDRATGVACDGSGNLYVAGVTISTNLPVTAGAFQTVNHGGGGDGFVCKLSPDGKHVLYGTYLGGASYDAVNAITVASDGSIGAAGVTSSSGLPTTLGAVRSALSGGADAFAAVLNPSGSGLTYLSYLGSAADDIGYACALRPDGSLVVTGCTAGPTYPTSAGAYDLTQNGAGTNDGFATAMNVGLGGGSTGVGDPGPPGLTLSIGANPSRGEARLTCSLPSAGKASVRILDAQGRVVRTLEDGVAGAGTHALTWDGRDDAGNDSGAGLYLVSLDAGGRRVVKKMIRIR